MDRPVEYRRLVRAVKNPDADRRTKHDWTLLPEWPEGFRFTVETRQDFDITFRAIYARQHYNNKILERDPRFALLVDASEIRPPTTGEILDAYDTSAEEYLEHIGIDEAALAAYAKARDEAEES